MLGMQKAVLQDAMSFLSDFHFGCIFGDELNGGNSSSEVNRNVYRLRLIPLEEGDCQQSCFEVF